MDFNRKLHEYFLASGPSAMSPRSPYGSARSSAMSPRSPYGSARSSAMSPRSPSRSTRSSAMSPRSLSGSTRSSAMSPRSQDDNDFRIKSVNIVVADNDKSATMKVVALKNGVRKEFSILIDHLDEEDRMAIAAVLALSSDFFLKRYDEQRI